MARQRYRFNRGINNLGSDIIPRTTRPDITPSAAAQARRPGSSESIETPVEPTTGAKGIRARLGGRFIPR